jgi:glycerol-3-phosphate acyltransferase PlsY
VVAVVDVLKGAAAALLIVRIQVGDPAPVSMALLQLMAGGLAIAGHIWPLFAKFKGGKGVATTIGVLIGIIPVALSAALAVWLILLFSSRIMSVASLGAAVMLPIAAWIWESNPDGSLRPELMIFTLILCVLIFFTHRSNIRRLLKGEELALGRSKAGTAKTPPPVDNASPKITDKVMDNSSENFSDIPVQDKQG